MSLSVCAWIHRLPGAVPGVARQPFLNLAMAHIVIRAGIGDPVRVVALEPARAWPVADGGGAGSLDGFLEGAGDAVQSKAECRQE